MLTRTIFLSGIVNRGLFHFYSLYKHILGNQLTVQQNGLTKNNPKKKRRKKIKKKVNHVYVLQWQQTRQRGNRLVCSMHIEEKLNSNATTTTTTTMTMNNNNNNKKKSTIKTENQLRFFVSPRGSLSFSLSPAVRVFFSLTLASVTVCKPLTHQHSVTVSFSETKAFVWIFF